MKDFNNFKPVGKNISQSEKLMLTEAGYSWCAKCSSVKSIDEFNSDRNNNYNIESKCSECSRKYAAHRRATNNERVKEIRRNSRNKHAVESRAKKNQWAKDNRERANAYKRNKSATDTMYRLAIACRTMVRRMFKSTGRKKCYKTAEILEFTPAELRAHLESMFTEGMTWDNYGDWHIDHIIPISSISNIEEGIELSKLSNLQPLWKEDNLAKGNRY